MLFRVRMSVISPSFTSAKIGCPFGLTPVKRKRNIDTNEEACRQIRRRSDEIITIPFEFCDQREWLALVSGRQYITD